MPRISQRAAAVRRPAAPGFTLIELMITVAIIGILTAIALPSYKESVSRGRRADVQTVLLQDAQYMQRYYAANNTYATVGGVSPKLVNTTSPANATGGYVAYTVSLVANSNTATGYKLQAVPQGSMANDRCGSFTYDNTDQKGITGTGSGASVPACWK